MNEPYGFGFAREYGGGANCGYCYCTHPAGTPHPFIPLEQLSKKIEEPKTDHPSADR